MSDPTAIVRDVLRRMHTHSSIESMLSDLALRLEYAGGATVVCCYLLDPARYELRLAFLDDARGAALARLEMLGVAPGRAVPRELTAATLDWLAEMGHEPVAETGVSAALIAVWGLERAGLIWRTLGLARGAVAAVRGADEVVGFVVVADKARLTPESLEDCAAHAALAVGRAAERQRQERSPSLDQGTGLFTAEHFAYLAEREMSRAIRFRRTLSLVVLQPPTGEGMHEAPRATAALLTRNLRRHDTAGRLDERHLAALLPETQSRGAITCVRRLRRFAPAELDGLRVGVASFPNDGRDFAALVERAQERLSLPDGLVNALGGGMGLRDVFPSFPRLVTHAVDDAMEPAVGGSEFLRTLGVRE